MAIEFKILDIIQGFRTPIGRRHGDVFHYKAWRRRNYMDWTGFCIVASSKDEKGRGGSARRTLHRYISVQWNVKATHCENSSL